MRVGDLVRIRDGIFDDHWKGFISTSVNPNGQLGVITKVLDLNLYPFIVRLLVTGEEEAFSGNELEKADV